VVGQTATVSSIFFLQFFFFFYLVCETIGTAATPWPIVPASDDSEDDCGEQMECRLAGETEVLGELTA
jgi:hypothetical protein